MWAVVCRGGEVQCVGEACLVSKSERPVHCKKPPPLSIPVSAADMMAGLSVMGREGESPEPGLQQILHHR